jgi:hypothetical protein
VGNRTVEPLSLVVWVDNVAPVITMTGASPVLPLGSTMTVLSGTVSDGGPATDVAVHIQTPRGEFRRQSAARDGDRWWFDLQPLYAGDYTVWVNASDQAGNVTTVGPFGVVATLEKVYLPLMVRNFRGLRHQIWLPLVVRE